MIFSQLLANGIIAGSTYALLAAGFALVYVTSRFVHLGHGAVAAAGAYFLYTFFDILGWNFYLSVFLAILLCGLLGVIIFAAVHHPLIKRKSSRVIQLIASLAVLVLIDHIILLIFGSDVKIINFIPVAAGQTILGATITSLQLFIIASSVCILAILWWLIWHTKAGKIIRAVADHAELAETTGINVVRVQYAMFFLGSILAGIAGVLIALERNAEPYMGATLIIKAFTGAVIGGTTSIPGAVLGSYLLGLVENFGIWYLPGGYKDAIAFTLLLIFLLVRPHGILGINKGVRL